MKTIGLIGGMSCESSVTYYQTINTIIKEQLGGFHSAKCLLYSVDFQEIETCQVSEDWEKGADILCDAAKKLELAGADFILICTNTMHKVADKVAAAVTVPLLHIADATARELTANKLKTVALLGTKYTMEQDFYKAKLIEHGINVMVPEEEDRTLINDVIYQELCLGNISPKSKQAFLKILDKLAASGAEGVILGCTEIGLLIQQNDTSIPLFDTALIHAKAAALQALE